MASDHPRRHRAPVRFTDSQVSTTAGRLKLIGDPIRVGILLLLSHGPLNAMAIAESTALLKGTISHHLTLLRISNIVEANRDSRHMIYSLTNLGWQLLAAIQAAAGMRA